MVPRMIVPHLNMPHLPSNNGEVAGSSTGLRSDRFRIRSDSRSRSTRDAGAVLPLSLIEKVEGCRRQSVCPSFASHL